PPAPPTRHHLAPATPPRTRTAPRWPSSRAPGQHLAPTTDSTSCQPHRGAPRQHLAPTTPPRGQPRIACMVARRLTAPVLLPCDPECSVVRDAVVDITAEGRIGYSGPASAAPQIDSDVPVTRLSGILLPGLIKDRKSTRLTSS